MNGNSQKSETNESFANDTTHVPHLYILSYRTSDLLHN